MNLQYMKKFNKPQIFLLLFMVILIISFACKSLTFEKEEEVSRKEAFYTINPNTILESIAQGKGNIFTLQAVTPEVIASLISATPVQWSQADYFHIAEALFQFAWNETLKKWSLDRMAFGMDCQDANYGPQYADFTFYKVEQSDGKESRLVRRIYILHQEKTVWWTEIEYFPMLADWGNIDLTKTKISVNDAFQIAERNGGYRARLGVENNCKVTAFLPIWGYDGWNITYTGLDKLFDINIDPLSGEYKILASTVK
jgi:hypothetical protein